MEKFTPRNSEELKMKPPARKLLTYTHNIEGGGGVRIVIDASPELFAGGRMEGLQEIIPSDSICKRCITLTIANIRYFFVTPAHPSTPIHPTGTWGVPGASEE
jgi:hypothetical protein